MAKTKIGDLDTGKTVKIILMVLGIVIIPFVVWLIMSIHSSETKQAVSDTKQFILQEQVDKLNTVHQAVAVNSVEIINIKMDVAEIKEIVMETQGMVRQLIPKPIHVMAVK